MYTYIALLRGINVGGNNKADMKQLAIFVISLLRQRACAQRSVKSSPSMKNAPTGANSSFGLPR
ncbi:DUF1697 domain-containing protein [Desulfosporosinus sp. PR]|uniref:DUF1697 domain-containing protein n=1 Tax=Candidatus Desulfosporosinus nitrosoreducens TaxID=3401928 RepID=UPI0027FCB9A3|nr:DUF1697 domain-containing protein [Desulfosporosinus sp. PR]